MSHWGESFQRINEDGAYIETVVPLRCYSTKGFPDRLVVINRDRKEDKGITEMTTEIPYRFEFRGLTLQAIAPFLEQYLCEIAQQDEGIHPMAIPGTSLYAELKRPTEDLLIATIRKYGARTIKFSTGTWRDDVFGSRRTEQTKEGLDVNQIEENWGWL